MRIPTEKAHGIQVMKMCEAFALKGHSVELVVPNRKNSIIKDPFEYYSVKKVFSIKKIHSLDIKVKDKLTLLIQSVFFALFSAWYVLRKNVDIIYSRDEFFCGLMVFLRNNIFFEIHNKQDRFFTGFIYRRAKGIVAITEGLKKYYLNKYKICDSKILVASDAVDLNEFNINIGKDEAIKKVCLSLNKKIILYTGHLYGWKGVNILAEAAKQIGENSLVVFVGGTEKDIAFFKERYAEIKNIMIVGQKPHSDIPLYLKAADVLILPNSGKEDISRLYTSPMKLFEYMASGVPIVASDLPSIREILNENNAVLIESDNPIELATGIKEVLDDKNLAERISRQARLDVIKYTWEKRAENIINFIQDKA